MPPKKATPEKKSPMSVWMWVGIGLLVVIAAGAGAWLLSPKQPASLPGEISVQDAFAKQRERGVHPGCAPAGGVEPGAHPRRHAHPAGRAAQPPQ